MAGATALVYHPRQSTVTITPTKAWLPDTAVRRVDEFTSQVVFGSIGTGHHQYTLAFE